MASPTAAEVEAQLKAAVDAAEGYLSASTVATDVDAFIALIESDFAVDMTAGAASFRAAAAEVISKARDLILPVLVTYTHHIVGTPERQDQVVLDRLYKYFVDNSKHVKSRGFSRGSVSAGSSNVGNGTIKRLTKDERGYDLESSHAEARTLRCIADANTGALRHKEHFELRGTKAGIDLLAIGGSGLALRDPEICRAIDSTDSIFPNAGFSDNTGTQSAGSPYTLTANDEITGWTLTSPTNMQLDVDELYRSPAGITSPVSLRLLGNCKLERNFYDDSIRLNPNVPYYREIAVMRESSADGTLTLRCGSQDISVAVNTLTNDQWTTLAPSMDEDLWPLNFIEADATFEVELSSNTTGDVVIAEVIFVPMFAFDGVWHVILGGNTKFKLDDTFTWTDSIASDSKIQKWLWILFGRYLPHVANATEITAEASRTLTFANSGSADTITASSGSFIDDGYKAGMLVTIAGTSNNNMTTGPIASVTATVLTFGSDTSLTAEGPLSSTATLNATSSITDPS